MRFDQVSVIIPAYRAARTLERAIRSVAAQTRPPAEVIVVDDASDDATPRVVAELAAEPWPFAFKSLRLAVNVGAGEARNAGWNTAEGAWLAFLDADDAWLPHKLERQVAWMTQHPEYMWSAHRCSWGGPWGRCEGGTVGECDDFEELTSAGLLWRNPVATPTVLLRRDVPHRFRTGWRHCEDLMLWQDILAAGCRGALLHEPLACLGRAPTSPGGLTGDLPGMHAGELRVLSTLRCEGKIGTVQSFTWWMLTKAKYARRRIRR